MRLRTELSATVAGFLILNLLLVFTAIGLFARMGPAIEHILLRNGTSIAAGQEALEVLASADRAALDDAERERLTTAIDRARKNITEPGEDAVLTAIDKALPAVLAGDHERRLALITDLRQLIAVNRQAMERVDLDARRLGRAGGWIAVFTGIASLALGVLLTKRLGGRVVRPLQELRDTLAAARDGDHYRRCSARGAATELRQAMTSVNDLLDRTAPPAEEEAEGQVAVR